MKILNKALLTVFGLFLVGVIVFTFGYIRDLRESAVVDENGTTEEEPPAIPDDIRAHIESKSDLIVVSDPKPLTVVTSPLTVRGEARGYWFFEASFPLVLVDWDGRIIAESYATAVLDPNDPESTWMTEDFVPFEGVIEFEDPSWDADFSKRGAIIFQKDNPSGLPENDDALEIPVWFAPLES